MNGAEHDARDNGDDALRKISMQRYDNTITRHIFFNRSIHCREHRNKDQNVPRPPQLLPTDNLQPNNHRRNQCYDDQKRSSNTSPRFSSTNTKESICLGCCTELAAPSIQPSYRGSNKHQHATHQRGKHEREELIFELGIDKRCR